MSHDYYKLLSQDHPAALKFIHNRYSRMVYWLGKGIINDDFIVECLVQDTFLKLWANRDKIESEKHLFFFLRMVMKRECYTYYTSPKRKFFQKINSLESYENYQDYLAGYDPKEDIQNQKDHESQQDDFELVQKVLPLLIPERKRLIELCLKYGFRYKVIARVMGISITEASNEVKQAIQDLKNILNHDSKPESKPQSIVKGKVQDEISTEQQKVMELRCTKKYSFEVIATELNLSHKQVHAAFAAAYKLMQEEHNDKLELA